MGKKIFQSTFFFQPATPLILLMFSAELDLSDLFDTDDVKTTKATPKVLPKAPTKAPVKPKPAKPGERCVMCH